MEWGTIESAPKNKKITLYCENSGSLLYECRWSNNLKGWETIDVVYGHYEWVSLEPYEKPSHWIKIEVPGGDNQQ